MTRKHLATLLLLTLATCVWAVNPEPQTVSEAEGDQAWCQPEAGFQRALAGEEQVGPCQGRDFRVDFELGRNLRNLREERAALQQALADVAEPATIQAQRARLRVLERELQQVEGLARIRGLLPLDDDVES